MEQLVTTVPFSDIKECKYHEATDNFHVYTKVLTYCRAMSFHHEIVVFY